MNFQDAKLQLLESESSTAYLYVLFRIFIRPQKKDGKSRPSCAGARLFPTVELVFQFRYLTAMEYGLFDALPLLLAIVFQQAIHIFA